MEQPALATIEVVNTTRSCILAARCELARTFWKRFLGLMGRASLASDSGLLIYPENSIHMFFMRFPIDVLFVNKQDQVIDLREAMPPNRSVATVWGARYVIELPAQVIAQTGTAKGDQLTLTPSPHLRRSS
jgi:hypothetical protein